LCDQVPQSGYYVVGPEPEIYVGVQVLRFLDDGAWRRWCRGSKKRKHEENTQNATCKFATEVYRYVGGVIFTRGPQIRIEDRWQAQHGKLLFG
jgi:hypothetical protein